MDANTNVVEANQAVASRPPHSARRLLTRAAVSVTAASLVIGVTSIAAYAGPMSGC